MTAAGNYINEINVNNWATLIVNYAAPTSKIAFVAADRTITDADSKFISKGFKPNMRIVVLGSVSNDGSYTVSSLVAGIITLIGTDSLTDEDASAIVITITSGERQETIERAEALIEQVTYDYFYAAILDIYRDGNGEDRLNLGLKPDILSITSVAIHGVALNESWYTNDAHHIYLDPDEAYTSESAELHFRTKYKQGLFPKGRGNIRVIGTYGWSVCPPAIKQAAVILCRFESDGTLYTKYDDVDSDRLGDKAYTRKDKQFLTGLYEADDLVRNYIRRKSLMGVA